jgi:hypothetical protein
MGSSKYFPSIIKPRKESVNEADKKEGEKRAFRGDIQWDILHEDGSSRIREVNDRGDRWE